MYALHGVDEISEPFPITKEMADFAGWDDSARKSRLEITKAICTYIKETKLQNPDNPREILPDEKLASLLKYNTASVDRRPLTFYHLQDLIGQLQVK